MYMKGEAEKLSFETFPYTGLSKVNFLSRKLSKTIEIVMRFSYQFQDILCEPSSRRFSLYGNRNVHWC